MNKILKLGFTLLESLACIAIIGIIALFSMTNSTGFSQKNQVQMITADLRLALTYARNMALKSDESLILAPLIANDWSKGIVLLTAKDKVFRQWEWPKAEVSIEWKGFRSHKYILFSSELRQATANGVFLIRSRDGAFQQRLILNRLGRIDG